MTTTLTAILASAYLHQFDPFVFRIWDNFGPRWYGTAYLVGFLVAWLTLRWMAKTSRCRLTAQQATDVMFAGIAGVLIGGRLGYVLFYKPHLLWSLSGDFPWWGVLAIHDGGMSVHGGILGVVIALIWFANWQKIGKLHLLDVSALLCTPGLFFGRIANFINGELRGRPLPDHLQGVNAPWWSIRYPKDVYAWTDQAQFEPFLHHLPATEQPARAILDELERGNERVIALLHESLTAHYPSQLVQAVTDGPLLALALVLIWLVPRKPGVIGGWFLVLYGVMRIATELIRTPDEGVALLAGLTRGQVLSVLMIVSGAIGLWIVTRRRVEPIGGLRKLAPSSRH